MAHARLDDQFDDEPYGLMDAIDARYGYVYRKPSNIAWAVGTIVTVGFVFSNALFFQNTKHPAAFFETRGTAQSSALQSDELEVPVSTPEIKKEVTRIVYDTDADADPDKETQTQALPKPLLKVAPRPTPGTSSDMDVVAEEIEDNSKDALSELQGLLSELSYYEGEIDGLTGPKTRAAIDKYKANVGLKGIDLSYEELALSARNNLIVTAAVPKARPKEEQQAETEKSVPETLVETVKYTPPTAKMPEPQSLKSNTVTKVQAGLRAFGNTAVTVDGLPGEQTENAIKEFQSLFRLPVTGKIDERLIEKMTAVGLIN